MKYVIMAAGEGKRWNNYLGIPKHLIEINGETLLGRTTRLLKENGITNYIITCNDACYAQYGPTAPQTVKDCEIDRFEETVINGPVCYLYGDVYYTENAIKTIINTPANDIQFFGHPWEIFAIKINYIDLFLYHKHHIKELFLKGEIDRCIGWEIYRSLNSIPLKDHIIRDRYTVINDGTDDIDYPHDYEEFKERIEGVANGIH